MQNHGRCKISAEKKTTRVKEGGREGGREGAQNSPFKTQLKLKYLH